MKDEEKALLEYVFEQQNNLLDYMQRNDIQYSVSAVTYPDECGKPYISVDIYERHESGNLKRIITLSEWQSERHINEYLYPDEEV